MRAAISNHTFPSAFLLIVLFVVTGASQSTTQEFPSPVTSNEISGVIRARDLGDSRLTSHYYQFDGSQGDLFINIVTKNFTGDIDVFTLTGLRPMTKIVVYADSSEHETGRVLYLRKPEKMLMRIQGRTPGDEPASYRIKFAGSFVASSLPEPPPEPALPNVTAKNESGIRVNSVGTIVEVIPKATPLPVPPERTEAKIEPDEPKVKTDEVVTERTDEKLGEPAPTEESEKKVAVVVTENLPEKTTVKAPPRRNSRARRRPPPKVTTPDPEKANAEKVEADNPPAATTPSNAPTRGRTRGARNQTPQPPKAPDPLEKINLVIAFKDGSTMSRPMSEILRFTVDKGILTVIHKNGTIGRYSMLDVAKVTIE